MEKCIKYIFIVAGTAAGLFLLPFFIRAFMPFVVAMCVALPCQRIVLFLKKHTRISHNTSSTIIATLIIVLLCFFVCFLIFQIILQLKSLVDALPAAVDLAKSQLARLDLWFEQYKAHMPVEIGDAVDGMVLSIKDYSLDFSKRSASAAISKAGVFAAMLPDIFLFIATFILSVFFFTKDFDLVKNFIKELLPCRLCRFLSDIKGFLAGAFSSYFKAQLILMLISGSVVALGLWICRIDYFLFWGLLSALVDALPILGTAAVLIPLALYYLLFGDLYSFVAILILQAVVFLIRQLAEPRIVSRHIGIHPIFTLVGIYVGLKYFGVLGMIFAPFVMLLLVNIYTSYKESKASSAEL